MKQNKQGITVKALIGLLPVQLLEQIAEATEVNRHVKKLNGETMFQLLLMSVLNSERVSLRVMEDLYASKQFQVYAGLKQGDSTRYTSLSDRLMTIKVEFFEQLFKATYQRMSEHFKAPEMKQRLIMRYDSTSIAASAKLLQIGMVNGMPDKNQQHRINQIKVTIGFDGLLSRSVAVYHTQPYLGEDKALGEAILSSSCSKDSILVFDRGLKKRTTFATLSKQGKTFITRINPTRQYQVLKTLHDVKGKSTETLKLISDEQVYLYHRDKRKLKVAFRLIRAQSKLTGEKMFFLSNEYQLDACSLTEIYKSRWEIEVFFRFLKQEMNLKHFTSYSLNGIQVMLYVILIAAMLIMLYKRLNNIKSYKRAKLLFIEALDTEIVRRIVVLCGGDPNRSAYLTPT